MASETYRLKLGARGPYVGCENKETFQLSEYGYSDEEWDALAKKDRDRLLDEWAMEFMVNEGYECWANVEGTNG